jgi:hypothetical protein
MAYEKIKYHIDKDTNTVVREHKRGNKIEYETMSMEQYEKEDSMAGCIAFIVIAVFVIWIIVAIARG